MDPKILSTLADLFWAALAVVAVVCVLLDVRFRRSKVTPPKVGVSPGATAEQIEAALKKAMPTLDVSVEHLDPFDARWLEDFDTELYTAADARAHHEALIAESNRAAEETDRHRRALLRVGGIKRQAMYIYAEMSACRARRAKQWADHFERAIDMLEDHEDDVAHAAAPIAEDLDNVPREDKMGEQPPAAAPAQRGPSNG